MTISQGAVCGIPKQEQTIRYYMNRADETLYEVKKVGKNNFGVSDVDYTLDDLLSLSNGQAIHYLTYYSL